MIGCKVRWNLSIISVAIVAEGTEGKSLSLSYARDFLCAKHMLCDRATFPPQHPFAAVTPFLQCGVWSQP